MQATDTVMRDHRVIEQVLQVLETIGEQGEATKLLDASAARAALDFCRTFADGVHHAKEEAHLFPMLEANGFGGGCGPVAILRREHELGRLYVQGMAAAVEAAAAGDPDALQGFVQHAQRYVTLLRSTSIRRTPACSRPQVTAYLSPNSSRSGPHLSRPRPRRRARGRTRRASR